MKTIEPKTITEYEEAIVSAPLVLVDFYKDNCPGCKMLDMSFKQLEKNISFESVTLVKAKMETLGEDFFRQLGLRQTPTVFVMINGEEKQRLAGFSPPAVLEKTLTPFL